MAGIKTCGSPVSGHVYKKIEVVGSSRDSVEDAIQNAISTASKSLDHPDWFEVGEIRGDIKNGSVDYYRVQRTCSSGHGPCASSPKSSQIGQKSVYRRQGGGLGKRGCMTPIGDFRNLQPTVSRAHGLDAIG